MRATPTTRHRGRGRGSRFGVVAAVALLAVGLATSVAVGQFWLDRSAGRSDSATATDVDGDGNRARANHRGSRAAASRPQIGAQDPVPVQPTGRFGYATGVGPVLGTAGVRHRFRLAVEEGVPVEIAEFTTLVESTLGDRRSWIAGRDVRFQRVADAGSADFTIFLATPQTANDICTAGGVSTVVGGVSYTSCRVGAKVVINLDRYQQAVPHYNADLSVYRQYVINHEVGHYIGQNHVGCPGNGKAAPVMQQQTLALDGCTANAWPYLNGMLYSGPPGGE